MFVLMTKFCVMKFKRVVLEEDVSRMGREEMHKRFWWRDLKKREYLDDLAIDRNTALQWILTL
jgi:hypothetical protein